MKSWCPASEKSEKPTKVREFWNSTGIIQIKKKLDNFHSQFVFLGFYVEMKNWRNQICFTFFCFNLLQFQPSFSTLNFSYSVWKYLHFDTHDGMIFRIKFTHPSFRKGLEDWEKLVWKPRKIQCKFGKLKKWQKWGNPTTESLLWGLWGSEVRLKSQDPQKAHLEPLLNTYTKFQLPSSIWRRDRERIALFQGQNRGYPPS